MSGLDGYSKVSIQVDARLVINAYAYEDIID